MKVEISSPVLGLEEEEVWHTLDAIVEFFRLCPAPTAEQAETLARWFWATSYSGWFGGANSTEVQWAIGEMQEFARAQRTEFSRTPLTLEATPFPLDFDTRSARVRTVPLSLLKLSPRDPDTGDPLTDDSLVAAIREAGVPYVFPGLKNPAVSSPANRILLTRKSQSGIRQRLLKMNGSWRDRVLESHCIPPEAYQALVDNRGEEFTSLRQQAMQQYELDFMAQQGITPSRRPPSTGSIPDSDQE